MTERFSGLTKISKQPARRLLALANLKLDTPLESPVAASVGDVLAELDGKGAWLDFLRVMAAALPSREAIWWACLAAEDVLKASDAPEPDTLVRAREWVFKPSDETREQARLAAETAEPSDDVALCAAAVAMCDGKLGPGDLAQYEAPPGAAATMVWGMNVMALGAGEAEDFDDRLSRVLDRSVDIAKGGNGRLGGPDPTDEETT